MKRSFTFISILFLLFSALDVSAFRDKFNDYPEDSLFASDDILNLEIRADFSALNENRTEDADELEGELILYPDQGEPVSFEIKLSPRGNFRLKPENCKFPPLLVNFDKDKVPGTLFENQNKIKLVTPCQFEEDVVEEYIIYKLYRHLTDFSLSVRLCEIQYFDLGREKKLFKKLSFFIEDIDNLADRVNGDEIDRYVTPFDVNPEVYRRMTMFQYMIGNKDWYETTRHNIYLIQLDDTTKKPITVPYDFDFSGFVDADYTKPKGVPDELLESRRVYKGLCYSEQEFSSLIAIFNSLKPGFLSTIENQELLSRFARKQDVRYIERFFEIINDKELFKEHILGSCLTRKDYFKFED